MAAGTQAGLVDGVKFDLKRMHETWMEFVYPRQRGADETVLGKWTPQGGLQLYLYKLWSAVGAPAVALVYPFVLLGYFFRFQTRRIGAGAARIGAIGVVGLVVVIWGGLAVLAKFQFSESLSAGGVTAVAAASAVAILAAALAYLFWRLGGRVVTVLFAYPLAMTAIFLPPIVAALFSTAVAEVVLTRSDSIARWFVFEGPDLFGAKAYLVDNFERTEFAHVIIWFAVSIPVGWLLGTVVTLADLVRPTPE
ncbi:hypothetical protein ACKVMT_14535 [Halobacteriales archaeon Cl-PHB]